MGELPGQVMEHAAREGGILGLVFVLMLAFFVWYIHSSRKDHARRETILAEERKDWRETIERNTAAFHSMEKAFLTKPCLRPRESRTRASDHMD